MSSISLPTPTLEDNAWMSKYANVRYNMAIFEDAAKDFPNLISNLGVKITPANPDKDYYFESHFSDWALLFETSFTEISCKLMDCPSFKTHGETCNFETDYSSKQSFAFRSGDSTILTCHPWCFARQLNTKIKTQTRNDDERVDLMHTIWDKGKNQCLYMEDAGYNWIVDPYVRSDKKFTNRLNTFPTGAEVFVKNNDDGEIIYAAKHNTYYCDEFFRILNDEGNCKPTLSDKILSFTSIGTSLVQLTKQACNPDAGTRKTLDLKPDYSKFEKWQYEFEAWKLKIEQTSPNFIIKRNSVLTDFGFTDKLLTKEQRGRWYWHSFENSIIEQFILYKDLDSVTNSSYLDSLVSPYKTFFKYDVGRATIAEPSDLWIVVFSLLEFSISQNFKDFLWSVGVGFTEEILRRLITETLLKTIPKLITKALTKVFQTASRRIVTLAMTKLLISIAGNFALKISLRMSIMLAKLSSGILTVLAILDFIVFAFDLAFMFIDPLGFANEFDSKMYEQISAAQINALRQSVGPIDSSIDDNVVGLNLTPAFVMRVLLNYDNIEQSAEQDEETEVETKEDTRPRYYSDSSLFLLSCMNEYLLNRETNSYGQLFNWDLDILLWGESSNFPLKDIEPLSTLYSQLLSPNIEKENEGRLKNKLSFTQLASFSIFLLLASLVITIGFNGIVAKIAAILLQIAFIFFLLLLFISIVGKFENVNIDSVNKVAMTKFSLNLEDLPLYLLQLLRG